MTELPQVEVLIDRLADGLRETLAARGETRPVMVGIHTGGAWIAGELHRRLALEEPLGTLDIAFYRDDFTSRRLHPQVRPSHLPVPLEDRCVILVDDVIFSGRTIRAALNEIFDYGRPRSVILATLIDRGGRELPIAPDVVGERLQLPAGQQVKLNGPEPLRLVVRERA